MADGTSIEWTDATWNPIVGCSVISPGCTNCYAMKLAGTRLKNTRSRQGLTIDSKAGPVWNGEVRLVEQWIDQPLRWKRPRRIFVCAHGDLFHENVPDEWIDKVFAVMALSPQHTFQVLTKRAGRMREYCTQMLTPTRLVAAALSLPRGDVFNATWPLPNVWLGVSAEDQRHADKRVPELLATPAAVRFVSAEPLLGPIDFVHMRQYNAQGLPWIGALRGLLTRGDYLARSPDQCSFNTSTQIPGELPGLDWIIVGGESGAGARPMHPDWPRSIRDQCAEAGVAFFFKQWGEWGPAEAINVSGPHALCGLMGTAPHIERDWARALEFFQKTKGLSDAATLSRIGKKRAGRLLDGIEHSAFPRVPA